MPAVLALLRSDARAVSASSALFCVLYCPAVSPGDHVRTPGRTRAHTQHTHLPTMWGGSNRQTVLRMAARPAPRKAAQVGKGHRGLAPH